MTEVKPEFVNFLVKTLVDNEIAASDIHTYLINSWGEQNIPTLRHIQRLAKQFRDGERVLVKRKEGSGRPRTSRTEEHIEAVRLEVEQDNKISLNQLSDNVDLPVTTVYRILTKDLHKKSLYAKWIPHELTDANKVSRVNIANECLNTLNGGVVVIDEKWVYEKPHPPPQNIRAWGDSARDRPSVFRRSMSARKFHIIVGINFRGEHYTEVLEPGETVNSDRYIQFLQGIIHVRRRGTLSIMHDNATPHTSRVTRKFLEENAIGLVQQPPYSPDFNLCDRLIFRNFEVSRRGQVFNNVADVRNFLENYLQQFSRFILTNELANILDHLHLVIAANGDYV